MSDVSLLTILMKHINPSAKAQTAAEETGRANANEDAGKLMAVAPAMIQDKVDLSGNSGGGGAKANSLYSPAAIQGQNTTMNGSGGQGNEQDQESAPPISAADLAGLSVPGHVSSKPVDPAALASLSVPVGQHVDVKA